MTTPESDNNHANQAPSLVEATAAYDEVLAHNAKHTGFGAVFAGMVRNISDAVREGKSDSSSDGDVLDTPLVLGSNETMIEGEMSGDLQQLIHGDLFERIGLDLSASGSHVESSDGRDAPASELKLRLSNTSMYLDFLRGMSKEDVGDPKAEKLLVDVASQVSAQIRLGYGAESEKVLTANEHQSVREHADDALRSWAELQPEYERLGLSADAFLERMHGLPERSGAHTEAMLRARLFTDLDSYVTYWGRNQLAEYVQAQSGQLLTPVELQSFGPADWHKDGGGYPGWATSIDFANRLAANPETASIAAEIHNNLSESVTAALEDIHQNPASSYAQPQVPDLENVQKALRGEEYDAVALKEYVPLRADLTFPR